VFGASNRIPKDVLPHLAGKRVRIFQHDDDPGRNAGALCAEQLMATGVEVDGYSFAATVARLEANPGGVIMDPSSNNFRAARSKAMVIRCRPNRAALLLIPTT